MAFRQYEGLRAKGIIHDRAGGGSRRRGQALGEHAAVRGWVERRVEQLIERHRIDAADRLALRDQPLIGHIDRHLERGLGGALARARLEHFDAESAQTRAEKGDSVIRVRTETSPEDIHGMHAAKGILTARGGMTSHAAVVARGMGRPCVSGAGRLAIDAKAKTLRVSGRDFKEGDSSAPSASSAVR